VLSLLEDENARIIETLILQIDYKLLEECLVSTYKEMIYEYLHIRLSSEQELNQAKVKRQLVSLYKYKLGYNLHQSYMNDSNLLIKILFLTLKILIVYSHSSKEVQNYLAGFSEAGA